MIFVLTNTVTGATIYLPDKKEYMVGRKNCDILLENDQSISREHAILRVKDDHVTLEDKKSKYHTLHKGSQVEPGVEITLKHMDSIQFGMFNNKYCFESYKFIVAASALSSEKKTTLKQNLARCSGKYVDKWSNICTHLTVDKLTLTIKVLQALVDEKPIVTLDYWAEYADSIEAKRPLPNVNKYNKPAIAEQLLRSDFEYKIDPRRKTLFQNKLFVFLKSNTKKQMEDVIKSCGGNCISWEEEPKTLFDINRSPIEHLLVKTDNDEENISFDAIIENLGKQNQRPIPINEIALAIIHCSCDVNCNPSFNKVSAVFHASTQKHQVKDVLAVETQTENIFVSVKTETVIPPSVEDDWVASTAPSEANHNQRAETSGIKRTSKEQAGEKEPKKLKLGKERQDEVKRTKSDIFVEVHKGKTNIDEISSSKKKSPSSQKRKAVDETDATCSKLNPFSLMKPSLSKKSKSNEENPFELTRSSRPAKAALSKTAENPFASIMNVSHHTNPTIIKLEDNNEKVEQPRRQIKLVPFKSDTSGSGTSSTKRSIFNVTWMSKSSIKNVTVKDEDPEVAKIAEAFKDCVKVEVMPVYERSATTLSNTLFDSGDGKKNFKKFKKIRPLKPQVTIISRHQLKQVTPGDVTGIEVNDVDSEDEDTSANSKSKQVVKPIGKRFVL